MMKRLTKFEDGEFQELGYEDSEIEWLDEQAEEAKRHEGKWTDEDIQKAIEFGNNSVFVTPVDAKIRIEEFMEELKSQSSHPK